MKRSTKTLGAYYRAASPAERAAGRRWYWAARWVAARLAREGDISVDAAAGIMAALSPRVHWARNVRLARDCVRREPLNCLGHCARKAARIRDGADWRDVLRGPKEIAFCRAILGDCNAVVLDTWMLRPFGVRRATARQYEKLAQRLRKAAARAGESPAVFQAIVWCQIRGNHR